MIRCNPGSGHSFGEFLENSIAMDASSTSHSFQMIFKRVIIDEAFSLEKTNVCKLFQDTSFVRHDDAKNGPTVARFSLIGQAPRLTDAILLADRIHVALVELSDGSSIFTGCDGSGKPLKGHNHSYILSESNLALGRGCNGEITHVTVYAAAGFGPVERDALENLRDIHGLDIHLTLVSMGLPGDIGGLNLSNGECPLLAESRV